MDPEGSQWWHTPRERQLREDVRKLREQLDEMADAREADQQTITSLIEDRNELEEARDTLRAQLNAAQSECDNLRLQLDAAKCNNAVYAGIITSLNQQIDAANQTGLQVLQERKQLRAQIEGVENARDLYSQQLHDARNVIAHLRQQLEDARNVIAVKDGINASLNEQLAKMAADRDFWISDSDEMTSLQSENDHLRDQLGKAKAEKDHWLDEAKHQRNEFLRARDELVETRDQLTETSATAIDLRLKFEDAITERDQARAREAAAREEACEYLRKAENSTPAPDVTYHISEVPNDGRYICFSDEKHIAGWGNDVVRASENCHNTGIVYEAIAADVVDAGFDRIQIVRHR